MAELTPMLGMYTGIPTRVANAKDGPERIEAIRRFVFDVLDCVPFVPFDAGPYAYTEGNPRFGRKRSLVFDLGVQRLCDQVGIFGVSRGTLGEWLDGLAHSQPVRLFRQFDSDWDKYYAELAEKYGDPLNQHRTFAFIGPRTAGKTHLINYLLSTFPNHFERVKNTTTRKRRKEGPDVLYDEEAYDFVSRAEFEDGIATGQFLEFDEYHDNYYGSSRNAISGALSRKNGIFAITPKGAVALYDYRFGINFCPIVLKPKNQGVLVSNAKLRGISGRNLEELLREAPNFFLRDYIKHLNLEVTGTHEDYGPLVSLVEPLLYAHEG